MNPVEIEHRIEYYLKQTRRAWESRNAKRLKKAEYCLIASSQIARNLGYDLKVIERYLDSCKSIEKAFEQTTLFKRNIYKIL